MRKKGLAVWIFSTLTFISSVHLIEAIFAVVFNNPIRLLQLYPFTGQALSQMSAYTYLYVSAISTVILWGITCAIAFDNPIEAFLNKILSDAKKQTATETQVLEEKGELLDLMYETMESNNETLAQVKDLVRNMRAEVKDIQPMKDTMEKTRTDLGSLKMLVATIEEKLLFTVICPACGKTSRPDFQICPYCGEDLRLQQKITAVKATST
jgi:rubrerythrin